MLLPLPHKGAPPFFTSDPCVTTGGGASPTQGIIGVAFQQLASPFTDSFADALVAQHAAAFDLAHAFTLRLCEDRGTLWLGGSDPTSFNGSDFAYTPLGTHIYYAVAPANVLVGNVSLEVTADEWPTPSIIDSGTTLLELPRTIFDRVVAAILADAQFQRFFRHAPNNHFFDGTAGVCERPSPLVPFATLQSVLPTLTLRFTNGLSLTMDGVGSYLLPCTPSYTQFTSGLGVSLHGLIGGWALMNHFVVSHDLIGDRIGFAPVRGCPITPLRAHAKVLTLPAAAGSSSSSSSSSSTGTSGSSTGASRGEFFSSSSSSSGTSDNHLVSASARVSSLNWWPCLWMLLVVVSAMATRVR
jgi:hypothetical protein